MSYWEGWSEGGAVVGHFCRVPVGKNVARQNVPRGGKAPVLRTVSFRIQTPAASGFSSAGRKHLSGIVQH